MSDANVAGIRSRTQALGLRRCSSDAGNATPAVIPPRPRPGASGRRDRPDPNGGHNPVARGHQGGGLGEDSDDHRRASTLLVGEKNVRPTSTVWPPRQPVTARSGREVERPVPRPADRRPWYPPGAEHLVHPAPACSVPGRVPRDQRHPGGHLWWPARGGRPVRLRRRVGPPTLGEHRPREPRLSGQCGGRPRHLV